MTANQMLRVLAIGAATALCLSRSALAWEFHPLGPRSCTGEGIPQFECGNPQTIPDCEVTCFGRASCTDAQCDTVYVEGPLGPTDEIVTHFYFGPVCACVGEWNRLDTIGQVACMTDLLKRTDLHRSKTAKALARCETSMLSGRIALASGQTCAGDDPRTAQAIAASRAQAVQALASKCSPDVLTAMYGTDGPDSSAVFVDGLLRRAEAGAAADVGLALRTAVVAP